MLVIRNKRYVKKYRVGGTGIFDTLTKLITRAAASDIGKTAISAGKTAAKELATAAITAAKDAAIEKGKQLITKKLTQKNRDILDSLVNDGSTANGGAVRPRDVVRIQDLVKRFNGVGLKLAPSACAR